MVSALMRVENYSKIGAQSIHRQNKKSSVGKDFEPVVSHDAYKTDIVRC